MQKAIVCVDMDGVVLKQLEEFVIEQFGNEYVVETADKPDEALRVIQLLNQIGIDTAVLITGFYMPETNGLQLIEKVHKINVKTKAILLTRQSSIDSIERAVNSVNLYKIIKTSYKREEIVQVIKDACYRFTQEMELEALYNKLIASEKEKALILQSISEGMLFVDFAYNILWMNDSLNKEFDNKGNKCYEKLYGRSRPCHDCEAFTVRETQDMHFQERAFSEDEVKQVKYYPVQNNKNEFMGILISMTDITSKKKVEKINSILLEVAKYVNSAESIVQLYENIYSLIVKELSATYMCVAGKDYDNVFVEYVDGKNKLLSVVGVQTRDHQKVLSLMTALNNQVMKNDKHDYIITQKEESTEIVIGVQDKIMIFEFQPLEISLESMLTFIKSLADQIKIGIAKIESIKKITYQANHDSLTGLYNRDFFIKTVNGKIFGKRNKHENQTKYSLAVLDLNYFKEVNDSYGHAFGDEVLLTVSQRILKALRNGDVVARIGGDEFAILIQRGSKNEISKALSRIQELIAAPIDIGKVRVQIGSSIGLVYEAGRYKSSEQAIKDADIAMYEAKKDKSGIGNYRFYEKEIEEKLRNIRIIEDKLKDASENKEFSIRYQPIIAFASAKIIGFEAFIRWENKGILYSPNEFLPIAEEAGQMEDIGQFVLEEVSGAIDVFSNHEEYKDCFISINLSTKQLFSDRQIDIIEKLGINNKKIQIEVTEKTLFDNYDKAFRSLEKLNRMGIKVHLDDFGTGYSSISCLNSTDIQDIKIDHTFVKQLMYNDNCKKVVMVIISVAKALGMTVTAEGVETKEQKDFLAQAGCDYAQGYYFYKPLTINGILELNNKELSII